MKLDSAEKNVVQRSGDLNDEAGFTISMTATAIEVLSSGIYKDPQLAILRELGTNAADSHIMAGKKDTPFDVTLPTWANHELVIRDYGVGLSYDQAMTIYRTYFGSDKRTSNDVTGCLGLGSKSPLAYTDQFTVTSWFGGEKSVYTIYKNENGLPRINRLTVEKSDEPTGVEIRIAIKKQDFNVFRDKAKDAYRWFNPRPKVSGLKDADYGIENIVLTGDRWALTDQYQRNTTVCMGNIGYRVERFDLLKTEVGLNDREKAVVNAGPIIYVNIGDVDIAASRETLQLTKKTYAYIKSRLSVMADEIVTQCLKTIEECPTLWDARIKLRELRKAPHLNTLLEKAQVVWKGIRVHSNILTTEVRHKDNKEIKTVHAVVRSFTIQRRRRSSGWTLTGSDTSMIEAHKHTEIYIPDCTGYAARLRYHLEGRKDELAQNYGEQNRCTAYLIWAAPAVGTQTPGDAEKKALEKFLKAEQIDGIIKKCSDLPIPPKSPSDRTRKTAQVLECVPTAYNAESWKEVNVDFDKGGVYVDVSGYHWSSGKVGHGSSSHLRDRLSEMRAVVGLSDKDVVGVRSRSLPKFEKAKQWVRLDEYVAGKVKKADAAKKLYEQKRLWERLGDLPQRNEIATLLGNNPGPRKSIFTDLAGLLMPLHAAATSSAANAYEESVRVLEGAKFDELKPVEERIRKLYARYLKRYPMLPLVTIGRGVRQQVIDYVKHMDRKAGVKDEDTVPAA